MSGQAGACIQSKYYNITYTSGMFVSPAIPPEWDWEKDGDYHHYFYEEENKPFRSKLNILKPQLDSLFEELVQQKRLPIIPYNPKLSKMETISFNVNGFEPVCLEISLKSELSDKQIALISKLVASLFEA